jgi:hypothetical protein
MSDLKPIATDELVNIFLRNTEYATLDELKEATVKKSWSGCTRHSPTEPSPSPSWTGLMDRDITASTSQR